MVVIKLVYVLHHQIFRKIFMCIWRLKHSFYNKKLAKLYFLFILSYTDHIHGVPAQGTLKVSGVASGFHPSHRLYLGGRDQGSFSAAPHAGQKCSLFTPAACGSSDLPTWPRAPTEVRRQTCARAGYFNNCWKSQSHYLIPRYFLCFIHVLIFISLSLFLIHPFCEKDETVSCET